MKNKHNTGADKSISIEKKRYNIAFRLIVIGLCQWNYHFNIFMLRSIFITLCVKWYSSLGFDYNYDGRYGQLLLSKPKKIKYKNPMNIPFFKLITLVGAPTEST